MATFGLDLASGLLAVLDASFLLPSADEDEEDSVFSLGFSAGFGTLAPLERLEDLERGSLLLAGFSLGSSDLTFVSGVATICFSGRISGGM